MIKKRGNNFKLNLDSLDKTLKFYKDLKRGDILLEAATELSKQAYDVMVSVYEGGKSNRTYRHKKYLSKPSEKTIAYHFFNGPPKPEIMGSGTFQIKVVNNYGEVNRKLKHLKWVEEGTRKSWTDIQPYLASPDGRLHPIKRRTAQTFRKKKKKRGFRIVDLQVTHKGQRARHFIKAFNSFIKIEGEQVIKEFIEKRMKDMGLSNV